VRKEGASKPAIYRIRLQGSLDRDWSDWFEGMAVTVEQASDGSPVTCLSGAVKDQSALRGLLSRVWDMNLTLISLSRLEREGDDERGAGAG
jgi:hypothetical protein